MTTGSRFLFAMIVRSSGLEKLRDVALTCDPSVRKDCSSELRAVAKELRELACKVQDLSEEVDSNA